MRRLFAGIAVPPLPALLELRERLTHNFPSLRWYAPANWHVTLQFYGMVNEQVESCLISQLRQVQFDPFAIAVTGLESFYRAGGVYI
jgi:2'-5' RNA ligase